jgi:hypothetical protein
MKKRIKKLTAEQIAKRADAGKSVTKYFTGSGQMKGPVQRVNVDFAVEMLDELDALARELNISRQAVIKVYLREALDRHLLAKRSERKS